MRIFLLILISCFLLSGICLAADKEISPLKITLELERAVFRPGEEINIKITYTNISSQDIKIFAGLKHWGNPFSCYAVNVKSDNPVKLIAPREKVGAGEEEMITLQPQRSVQYKRSLSPWLSFPGEGLYLLRGFYGPFWGLPETCSNIVPLQISDTGKTDVITDKAMALETILNDVGLLKKYWHKDMQGRETLYLQQGAATEGIKNLLWYTGRAEVLPASEIEKEGLTNYLVFTKFDYSPGNSLVIEYSYPVEGVAAMTTLKNDRGRWVEVKTLGAER